jgi:hypothetical protein
MASRRGEADEEAVVPAGAGALPAGEKEGHRRVTELTMRRWA